MSASPQSIFVIADLTNQKLRRSLGGSDFAIPKMPQRAKLRLRLRFSEQIGGVHLERFPTVREIRATIGQVDVRPETGQVSFKVGTDSPEEGTNVTSLLDFDFSASDLQTALNALSIVSDAVVVEDDDSFLVTGVDDPIEAYENTLRPMSFARVHSYTVNNSTTQAIRLQRAPFAFTDQFTQKVPDGPSIERIEAGGAVDDIEWPEVQLLTVPRDFAGSYRVLTDDEVQRTKRLGIGDGPEQVSEAINPSIDGTTIGLAGDANGIFTVSDHPTDPAMYIEFGGSMLGISQDLLKVQVIDAPPGDFIIELDLDTAATAESLRDVNKLTAPLEIFVDIEDPDDDEVVHTDVPVYRGDIQILESVTHDDLGTAQNINFLEPPAAKTYLPVSPDSISDGVRFYSFLLGDGMDTGPFAVAHNLSSPRTSVVLRDNEADGKLLVLGTDFDVNFDDDDELTITLKGDYASSAPDTNALAGTVIDHTLTSTWQSHSHPISDITNLQTILDEYAARITALEALAPTVALVRRVSGEGANVWETLLPPVQFAYPVTPDQEDALVFPEVGTGSLRDVDGDGAILEFGLAGSLVPAVHDATTEDLPSPLPAPAASYVDRVFENNTGSTVRLPGKGGRRSRDLAAGEFAACNGKAWYAVAKTPYGADQGESTFYPVDFVFDLFSRSERDGIIVANENVLRQYYALEVQLYFEAQLRLARTTELRAQVDIDIGYAAADSTPGTPSGNIDQWNWRAQPLLSQEIHIGRVVQPYHFGVKIYHEVSGGSSVYSASKFLYGKEYDADGAAPTGANFALRAKLRGVDVEDPTNDPRGVFLLSGMRPPQGAVYPLAESKYGRVTISR